MKILAKKWRNSNPVVDRGKSDFMMVWKHTNKILDRDIKNFRFLRTIPRFSSEITGFHFLPLPLAGKISLPNRGIVVPSRKSAKKSKIREVPDKNFVLTSIKRVFRVIPAGWEWCRTPLNFTHQIPGVDTVTGESEDPFEKKTEKWEGCFGDDWGH